MFMASGFELDLELELEVLLGLRLLPLRDGRACA
jgi:hypothetical protein